MTHTVNCHDLHGFEIRTIIAGDSGKKTLTVITTVYTDATSILFEVKFSKGKESTWLRLSDAVACYNEEAH